MSMLLSTGRVLVVLENNMSSDKSASWSVHKEMHSDPQRMESGYAWVNCRVISGEKPEGTWRKSMDEIEGRKLVRGRWGKQKKKFIQSREQVSKPPKNRALKDRLTYLQPWNHSNQRSSLCSFSRLERLTRDRSLSYEQKGGSQRVITKQLALYQLWEACGCSLQRWLL